MNWHDAIGQYSSFISLGANCQTAYQLRRLGLRRRSGPLDWFETPSAASLTRLLRNRFQGFMELDRLQLTGMTGEGYVAKDTLYNAVSYHDFSFDHPPEHWHRPYAAFKATLERRIGRFHRLLRSRPVCLVRTQTTLPEARQLQAVLDGLTTTRSYRLLIVNAHANGSPAIQFEQWPLARAAAVTIPAGTDWRGHDASWDRIMSGFSLR